jgi:hypothetical protein
MTERLLFSFIMIITYGLLLLASKFTVHTCISILSGKLQCSYVHYSNYAPEGCSSRYHTWSAHGIKHVGPGRMSRSLWEQPSLSRALHWYAPTPHFTRRALTAESLSRMTSYSRILNDTLKAAYSSRTECTNLIGPTAPRDFGGEFLPA